MWELPPDMRTPQDRLQKLAPKQRKNTQLALSPPKGRN